MELRRLLQLIPVLHRAKSNSEIYFVDEIDRSMHPMLIWKFLESFVRSCCGQGSQLIVTTHESNLLDLELFRRDEIFFVEKSDALETQIYSLMDFVRKDLENWKTLLARQIWCRSVLG
ncbi:MAG: ATP-binding protein [Candidatus Accumulibacter sp.]|uniref:ATP-binding protein n=1 Tax=Candidatus Accumulibacter proximus TaxID=2954385 RepID=A0A935UHE2_9PROT|nr:ATP-binding protein [Candidatus Accumulibacter proximus]